MIKIHKVNNIKDAEKFGSFQVSLLEMKDKDGNAVNLLIDNNSVFQEIYSIGKKELTNLINSNPNPHKTLTSEYFNYWINNKDRLTSEYKEFCNSISFSNYDDCYTQEFIYDCIHIALIDAIFNYSYKLKIAHDYDDWDSSELLELITLLDINNIIDGMNKIKYDDFIYLLEDLRDAPAEFNKEDIEEINNKADEGIMALEDFIQEYLNKRCTQKKYQLLFPYFIKIEGNNCCCAKAYSLMGICYNKLRLNLSGFNVDRNYHKCKYYKCLNYFTKKHNRQVYCPECIENHISDMLKHKKEKL